MPTGEPLFCGGRGRPVDVEVLRNGDVLVSDEVNSLVYRLRYTGRRADCVKTFGNCGIGGGAAALPGLAQPAPLPPSVYPEQQVAAWVQQAAAWVQQVAACSA